MKYQTKWSKNINTHVVVNFDKFTLILFKPFHMPTFLKCTLRNIMNKRGKNWLTFCKLDGFSWVLSIILMATWKSKKNKLKFILIQAIMLNKQNIFPLYVYIYIAFKLITQIYSSIDKLMILQVIYMTKPWNCKTVFLRTSNRA